MKKAFMLVLALLISVAFVTTVFAQPKTEAKPADKPAAVAPEKAPAGDKAVEKADKPAAEKKAAKKTKKAPKKEEPKKEEPKKEEPKKEEAKPAAPAPAPAPAKK